MGRGKRLFFQKTAAGVLVGSFLLAGCQKKTTDLPVDSQPAESVTEQISPNDLEKDNQIEVPSFSREEFPKIDGSTATLPLSIALYQMSTGVSYEEAEVSVYHSKTTSSYYNLIDGASSLVIAYEPDSSVFEKMDHQGVELNLKPIGKDALVFLANQGNPVKSLTNQQLVDIYSGKIKNWLEVGGDDKEIVAFQRPEGSGSQTLMEKLVMKGTQMENAPTSKFAGEMDVLIESVASYKNQENALGYSVYFFAKNMYQRPELCFMAVDGVMPDNETIKDGSYPYVNEFYAAVRADEPKDSPAYQLFTWLTTGDGQSFVEGLGYVGVSEGNRELSSLRGQIEYGDTSISLDGSRHLLMDGMFLYNEPGTAIFSQDMKSVRFIENISTGWFAKVYSLDEPVVVENEDGNYGLYDFMENQWILTPQYGFIHQNDFGNYDIYTEEGLLEFNPQGQLVRSSKEGEFLVAHVGDYIWKSKDDVTADVYDRNGNLVNQVDVSQYGSPSGRRIIDSHYLWIYENYGDESLSEFILSDDRGNLLFTKDDISDDDYKILNGTNDPMILDMQCSRVNKDGSFMSMIYAGKPVIFDLEQKKVVTSPEDSLNIYGDGEHYYYVVTTEEDTAVYEKPGVKMEDGDGNPYTMVIGSRIYEYMGYMGFKDGNRLMIDDINSKERIEIALKNPDDKMNCTVLAKGIFQIWYGDEETNYLYQKDQILDKGIAITYDNNRPLEKNQIIWVKKKNGQHTNYIFDTSGNLKYTSDVVMPYYLAEDEFFIANQGNYIQIMDYDGNVAVKMLDGYLVDD